MIRASAADIVVGGRVQGVGYRAWAEWHAARVGLVGYVTNLEDGRVQVHVEGDRAVIEAFVAALHDGPRLARVSRVEVHWAQPTGGFTSFAVRYGGEAS